MNTVITNEPHEILEIRPSFNGFNDVGISLVQKRRANIVDEWNIKVIILNKREALLVHKAISDVMLSPRQSYAFAGRKG